MSHCQESVSTVGLARRAPSLHALTSAYRVIFSRELDLILACCGDDSNGEPSARIQHIVREPNDLNWERLLQLAEHHGLVPLVYRRLSMAMDANQFVWLETFRQQNQINAHRTMGLTIELFNIHKHLAARRLEVLPYKGPALAQSLYGNIALRQFSDLDLLVRADDLPAIRSALAELGYRPGLHLTQAAERAYLKSGYEYTFDGAQGRNLIEIKWQILPRFYSIGFDVEGLFERAVEVDVGGRRLRTLCDQDLMLVLCVHAAKHAWMQLSSLRDIARLARSLALDWDALWVQAERLGIARIVAVSFLLARELFATALPQPFRVQDDQAAVALSERILPQIVADKEFDPESVGYFRLMMDLRERLRDRVSFLWRLWATPGAGEWSAIRLPSSLFPLYRVVRMFRLAGRMLS
jgi:Uncharacterised nucleotidyltransferase